MAILEFEKLTLALDINGRAAEILRDINLRVEPGQVLGLVGESGAGKSMIGRLVAGATPPGFAVTHGAVRFDGQDLSSLSPARHRALLGRRIAFIPQEPLSALNPVLTVAQQMREHLAHLGIARGEWQSYARSRLAEVGLHNPQAILTRYPHQLSGGQCQRILIAMTFCGNPALIVADEPTTALDVMTQAQIMRVLSEQQRRHGTAVILITHDLRLAAHVCETVAVLYAGEVVEYGPAAQVLDEPLHPYTRSLKAAAPALTGPRRSIPALPDFMPGVGEFAGIGGCRFYSRCPSRLSECESSPPALLERAEARLARCLPVIPPFTLDEEQQVVVHTPVADAMPLLELRQVALVYPGPARLFGKSEPFHALRPASFRLAPGELLGIVGESGSGKTSVARLIMGLVPPTSGQVLINGVSRAQADASQLRDMRKRVQLVFQNPDSALNPRRRVAELVTQIMEADDAKPARRELRAEIARQLLQSVGLPPDAAERYPAQLSGGQKQRVNIARALCVTPQLLVADEVVSGLDVSVQAQILNLLLRLNRELGIAVVFVSHDLAVVRYLCTRVLVMVRGEIVEDGATDVVFNAPSHAYTRALLAASPPESGAIEWPPAVDRVDGAAPMSALACATN